MKHCVYYIGRIIFLTVKEPLDFERCGRFEHLRCNSMTNVLSMCQVCCLLSFLFVLIDLNDSFIITDDHSRLKKDNTKGLQVDGIS